MAAPLQIPYSSDVAPSITSYSSIHDTHPPVISMLLPLCMSNIDMLCATSGRLERRSQILTFQYGWNCLLHPNFTTSFAAVLRNRRPQSCCYADTCPQWLHRNLQPAGRGFRLEAGEPATRLLILGIVTTTIYTGDMVVENLKARA